MEIRNVAIIAHVDHGKTTLVDALLRQSKTKLDKVQSAEDQIMDSNELERERGITIFSKNASVVWNGIKINIIDTPGHADFGGEVERVLSMADGCLLLVDAKEGPMPQTRFVLKQALKMGLKPIVVVNKIDKPDARSKWVVDHTFDLFVELGADEETAFFPVLYASGRQGVAGLESDLSKMTDINPIFEAIVKHVPAPTGDPAKPLQILVTTLGKDNFKGKIATGKIYNGVVTAGQDIFQIKATGEQKKYRVTSLITFDGLERKDVTEASAGDIVAIAGIPDVTIGETIADPVTPIQIPPIAIEEPTVKMKFGINTSPFAGREGEYKTGSQISERLHRETETDVALKVTDLSDGGWEVKGRGELHLAILIERMRREGFEFQVARPQVINKKVDGKTVTPYERVYIEVPEESSGVVIQKMGTRHSQMIDMRTENGIVYLEFLVATKELIGFRSEYMTDTKGLGIINTIFEDYREDDGNDRKRDRGSLVAFETGMTRLYGLTNVQDRGDLFVGPGVEVYMGQIVGQNSRSEDITVNVCKEKQLSNMRSKGDGSAEYFKTPREVGLEDALEYIDDTELVEVTPKSVRLRKIYLDPLEAKRQARK